MQSTSGTGQGAMQELEQQARLVMGVAPADPEVYPHPIAFNVLPHCDSFTDDGFTREELKLRNETRKIMGLPELRISATCTRVPVFVGHSESVPLETRHKVDVLRKGAATNAVQVLEELAARGRFA